MAHPEIISSTQLLALLVAKGGAIVSSNSCGLMEIADARVRGDFYVDSDGLGYVLRQKKWLDRVHERDNYHPGTPPRPPEQYPGHFIDEMPA